MYTCQSRTRSPSKTRMSALGTVTDLPSLRRYSTSICAMTVSPDSYTFRMWWVSPSMAEKKPATASRTAARPVTGSAFAKRNFASGVRRATNLSGSNASMSAKIEAMSRLMVHSFVGAGVGGFGSAGGFLVGEEGLGRRRAPQVRGDIPVVGHPAVVDLVDVGEHLDPRAPRIGVVVEEVRSDGVAAQAPACLVALGAHPVGADRDRVDGRDLEAGVVEAAVGAGDEAEDVVIARPGVQERHH